MILFINGAFGVGKTTAAEILAQRLPNSLLFDPEEVGFFLRNVLGTIDPRDDFQDYPLWRSLVITTTAQFRQTYDRTLIMPMALWHRPYFDEIMGGLHQIEPDLHHFCLTASVETIHQRLTARGNSPGDWAWIRAERCCAAFLSPNFDTRISTESVTPDEIVETILTLISR